MKYYFIVGGLVILAVGGYFLTSWSHQTAWKDLNTPEQLAVDECLAGASVALQKVFVEVCSTRPAIDPDRSHCADWSTAAIFQFMSEQSDFPAFRDALAVWNEKAERCRSGSPEGAVDSDVVE
jgi:hypothetical protein